MKKVGYMQRIVYISVVKIVDYKHRESGRCHLYIVNTLHMQFLTNESFYAPIS